MSPVNKIIIGLGILMALAGGVFAYLHFTKPVPVKEKAKEEKRKVKRTYSAQGVIQTEEIDEVIVKKETVIKPKPYLFGVTLGYDFDRARVRYNIMAGKQVTESCYAIGKTSTEFNNIEAGALCVF